MEDANSNMPHSTLTTNSVIQKQARQKRRIILLQKRANTCQENSPFQVASIINTSASCISNDPSSPMMEIQTPNRTKEFHPLNQTSTQISFSAAAKTCEDPNPFQVPYILNTSTTATRKYSSSPVMEIQTPNKSTEFHPFNQNSSQVSSAAVAISPQSPLMTLRGTSFQFPSRTPLSNLTTTEMNMSYSIRNSHRGQCSTPKLKSSVNNSSSDENCSPNQLMQQSPSHSSSMTTKSHLTTLEMNLTPILNQIDMVQNSSTTNKVLQKQARQKRMLIDAQKRSQRRKIAAPSSTSNEQPNNLNADGRCSHGIVCYGDLENNGGKRY